jgi:sugar/nucleoside kinase (ribokinase family)
VDLLFLNDEEARQLSGENSLLRAVRKVQKMGPSKVVVKKGEHGALLFDGDSAFSIPAMLLERVYDPTGAGDCFAGGFLGYMARHGDLGTDAFRRAMGYGTVLASFVTEQFSVDRLVDLSDEDIDGRLLELRELTRWPA